MATVSPPDEMLSALRSLHSGNERLRRRCDFPCAFRASAWVADARVEAVLSHTGLQALELVLVERITSLPPEAALDDA